MTQSPHRSAVVLVPIKAFDRAKGRLADHLDPSSRETLARAMAQVVLDAAAPLGVVVVCEDPVVAAWARDRGAGVAWTPGLDLNGALAAAVTSASTTGSQRVVIAHGDLPFASNLVRFADVENDQVVIVSDRHRDGTNVMSLPTSPQMKLHYGTGSLRAHLRSAGEVGLAAVEVVDEALGWDVDEPADLHPPSRLGVLPHDPGTPKDASAVGARGAQSTAPSTGACLEPGLHE